MFRPSAASEKMRNGVRIAASQYWSDRDDADAILQDREDLLVGGVARLELAGFAVQHRLLPGATRAR